MNENFKNEYLGIFAKDNVSMADSPIELSLLYLYKTIYDKLVWSKVYFNANMEYEFQLLDKTISKICEELQIDIAKIMNISITGKPKPKSFNRHINWNNIPNIYEEEFKMLCDYYNKYNEEFKNCNNQDERMEEGFK